MHGSILDLLILFAFFVSMWDRFGQSVQLFAVIEFDFRFSFEHILKLIDNAHLNLQPVVKTFQLLVQLDANVWKRNNKIIIKRKTFTSIQLHAKLYEEATRKVFNWRLYGLLQ